MIRKLLSVSSVQLPMRVSYCTNRHELHRLELQDLDLSLRKSVETAPMSPACLMQSS